jgi:hypothetical protein
MDDLISNRGIDILKGMHIYKGEIPGYVYIIGVNPNIDQAKLDYCSFFDPSKNKCKVYEDRPIVCQTYGDPKFNECPYSNMTNEELTTLAETDYTAAYQKHQNAKNNPINFWKEFIIPYLEAWEKAVDDKEEFIEWWEKLPTANFIRK